MEGKADGVTGTGGIARDDRITGEQVPGAPAAPEPACPPATRGSSTPLPLGVLGAIALAAGCVPCARATASPVEGVLGLRIGASD